MSTDYEPDDLEEMDVIDSTTAGDIYRDSIGREFEVLDVNYMFEIVKVYYTASEEEESIPFSNWRADLPTLVKEAEWPETNVVLGEPEAEEPQVNNWSDEDDEDDEEERLNQIKNMAARVKDSAYERYRDMGYDYEQAKAMASRDASQIVTNYLVQRMARD
jgi:hypothetical protein